MFDYGNPYGMYGLGSIQATQPFFQQRQANIPQQMQNVTQQQMAAPQSNMDWIRVNTMDDVANVTVQPNTKAWIMLANDPVFVVKSADGMGITTTDAFRFEKITGSQKPEYVTKQEFLEFVESLKKPPKTESKKEVSE